MLKLTLFELVTRSIPESFIIIFAMSTMSNIRLTLKKHCISSVILAVFQYIVRMLPINYGVNTIMCIFVSIVIMNKLNKVDIVKSIKSSLISVLVLFVCELINMLFINILYEGNLEFMQTNVLYKILLGIPSLIFFGVFFILYDLRKKKNYENNK